MSRPDDKGKPHSVRTERSSLTQFESGGSHGPIEDKRQYEKLVDSVADSDQREFLAEASLFATTCQYLENRAMELPPEIAEDVRALTNDLLSVKDRVARMREINHRLMEYIDQHDRQSPSIRQ